MHELAIAQGIVDGVVEHAGDRRVHRVTVAVGTMCAVVPDALRFAFELAAEDTVAAGAELIIEDVPARAACRTCGSEFVLRDPIALCACGSADVAIRSGLELRITSMEVSDPCARPAAAATTVER